MSMYGKYKPGEKAWPVTDCTGDKGFTVQADRDEADINKIVARIQRTGQLPPTYRGEPFYGDVSDIGDLQEAMIKVQESNKLFMTFPAEVRERFDNDPVKLVEFLSDDDNRDEALELGLIQKPLVAPVPDGKPIAPPAGPPEA